MFRVKSLSSLSQMQGKFSLFLQNFALGIFFNLWEIQNGSTFSKLRKKLSDFCILIDSLKVNLGMRVELDICLSTEEVFKEAEL